MHLKITDNLFCSLFPWPKRHRCQNNQSRTWGLWTVQKAQGIWGVEADISCSFSWVLGILCGGEVLALAMMWFWTRQLFNQSCCGQPNGWFSSTQVMHSTNGNIWQSFRPSVTQSGCFLQAQAGCAASLYKIRVVWNCVDTCVKVELNSYHCKGVRMTHNTSTSRDCA